MANRIDRVRLELDVYTEFEGTSTVKFEAVMDEAFEAAVRAQWEANTKRLWDQARANPGPFDIG